MNTNILNTKIIACILAFTTLGTFGFHRFYLNDTETGKKYFLAAVIGILTSWAFIGIIPLVGCMLCSLWDSYQYLTTDANDFKEKYGIE